MYYYLTSKNYADEFNYNFYIRVDKDNELNERLDELEKELNSYIAGEIFVAYFGTNEWCSFRKDELFDIIKSLRKNRELYQYDENDGNIVRLIDSIEGQDLEAVILEHGEY